MPKKPIRPKYTNSQITALIKEYIHNEVDQKMLYLRLVKGKTISDISFLVKRDEKTVRTHIKDGEIELFEHLPG